MAVGLPLLMVGTGLAMNMAYNTIPRNQYIVEQQPLQESAPEEVEVVEAHELHPIERAYHAHGFSAMQRVHVIELKDEPKDEAKKEKVIIVYPSYSPFGDICGFM
jgi:hypothetical protein